MLYVWDKIPTNFTFYADLGTIKRKEFQLNKRFFVPLLFSLLAFSHIIAQGSLRSQLELFFNLDPADSLVLLRQTATSQLELNTLRWDSIQNQRSLPHSQTAQINAPVLEKIKANALLEGISWQEIAFPSEPISPKPIETLQPVKELKQDFGDDQKLNYILSSTIFSSYVYGLALPEALQLNSDGQIAAGFLALPVSLGVHWYFGRGKNYSKADLYSASNFSSNAIFLSYTGSYLLLGANRHAYQASNLAVLGAYPLARYMASHHAKTHAENPGRILLQSAHSIVGVGFAGSLLGLYIDNIENDEISSRLAMATLIAGGVGGHYSSYLYRKNEVVPGGVSAGLLTFTLFGLMTSGSIIFSMDSDNFSMEGVSSILATGIAAGFGTGLWFFKDKQDNLSRGIYNGLGLIAGGATYLGILTLVDNDSPEAYTWGTTLSAMAGYAVIRYLTPDLVQSPRLLTSQEIPGRLTVSLQPTLSWVQSENIYTQVKKNHLKVGMELVNYTF